MAVNALKFKMIPHNPKLDLISIGDVNVDMIMRVPQHPQFDHRNKKEFGVRGSNYYLGSGGVAANVAITMSRLGDKAGLIGVIGNDQLGDFLFRTLTDKGVNLDNLRIAEDNNTTLVCCFEGDDGKTIQYSCVIKTHIEPTDLPQNYVNSAKLIFLAGNALTRNAQSSESIIEVLSRAKSAGVAIAIDPSKFWLNLTLTNYVKDAISLADVILPNALEAKILTENSNPSEAAKSLLKLGPKIVAIKLGNSGCLVCSAQQVTEVKAIITDISSLLGAGDAFNGGFLHGYLREWSLEKMANFANATASLKIRHLGTQEGLPTESDVEALLKN